MITSTKIYKVLKICLMSLLVILLAGTIFGMIRNSIGQNSRQNDIDNYTFYNWGQTFTEIGQLRISTAEPQSGIVILFVTFNFYQGDRAFTEELYLRTGDFRDIIMAYIGSFTINELRGLNEDIIKNELLRQFNTILRLGQIETLFFSDFMIVG